MAEIGTVIAIIQLADRVVELSRYWIEGIRDAESDLRSILIETSMLRSILENVRFLSDCSDGLSTTLVGLSTPNGPLSHCQRILGDIVTLIPTRIVENGHQPASEKDKLKLMMAKLGWAAKRSKAQKLLDELQRYKAAISLALITESLQDIKEIKTKTTLVLEALSDAEKREFCRWYQRTNPSELHNRAQDQYEEGTCEWIQRMPEWDEWFNKKNRCLWVHGIPGAGKTVLASYMVRQLESQCEDQADSITLYYYCYFANNQNEAAPLLRWIITELCRHTNSLPASAYKTFKRGREPNLPELLTALAEITEPLQTVYIVVDAVDESKPRDDLLKVLRDLVTDARFDKIQVVATSREYIDIERVLEDISTGVSMSNPFVTHDIALCVRSALQNGPRFKRWSKELLYEVESTLAAGAKGMFRWVICQLDRIRRLNGDATAVQKALSTLPRTLDETYQRIFAEIPEEDRDIVRLCLGWMDFHNVLFSDNIPLTSLLRALNSTQREQDHWSVVDQQDLKEICGCLVRISSGYGLPFRHVPENELALDYPAVVTFAHYTVREFLFDHRISTSPAAYFVLGEQLRVEIAQTVLSTAPRCNIEQIRCDLAELRDEWVRFVTTKNIFKHISNSLESYCALSALAMIGTSRTHYEPLSGLMNEPGVLKLALDFLDPCNPQIEDISALLSWWRFVVSPPWDLVPGSTSQLRFQGQNCATKRSSNIKDAMHLFMALGFARWSFFPTLARELFNRAGGNTAEILEAPLKFQNMGLQEETPRPVNHLSSSLMEFAASNPISNAQDSKPNGVDDIFWFMMSLPGVPSSPDQATAVLQAHSIAHGRYCRQSPTCFFKALFDLGANPHGMHDHATRSIQRTAGTLDWHGVEMLMSAGANVNDLGDPAGTMAGYDYGKTLFRSGCDPLNSWAGRSPLCILYHIREYRRKGRLSCSREKMQRTAEVLIRYGAKALRIENGEIVEYPEIRTILMRPFEEWNLPGKSDPGPKSERMNQEDTGKTGLGTEVSALSQ